MALLASESTSTKFSTIANSSGNPYPQITPLCLEVPITTSKYCGIRGWRYTPYPLAPRTDLLYLSSHEVSLAWQLS